MHGLPHFRLGDILSPVESTATNQIECNSSKPSSPALAIGTAHKTNLPAKNGLRLSSSLNSSASQMDICVEYQRPEPLSTKLSHSPSSQGIMRGESPRRKYFDSGDYELAKAGIVNAASVGSVHASPERLAASSSRWWSASSHQLHAESLFNSSCSSTSNSSSTAAIRPSLVHPNPQLNNSSSPIKQSFSIDEHNVDNGPLSFHASRLQFSIPEGDQMRE